MEQTLRAFVAQLPTATLVKVYGRVTKVIGMTVESSGPLASLGDICLIHGHRSQCRAEVIGFREGNLILVPLGELGDIGPGADVLALHTRLTVNCGTGLLGRIVDGLGQPMDGLGPVRDVVPREIEQMPVDPLRRRRIEHAVQTGVRVIDGLLTVGNGQRVGIFAGSGVGKSTLLSMIARGTEADVNVIALVGERGREVREFIERDLGDEGLKRSVVVVATSDQPALIRLKAAFVATAIAEHFRDEGLHVNFMMDSVTRFAMAQREVGLAAGEPPTARGYTPSVFAAMPKLLERTGPGEIGSITAFYTVLVDGDDMNDPIADTVRGILDGHIVLSRKLANAGHFPAVDVLSSVSRLFSTVADNRHQSAAQLARTWLSRFRDVEDLLRIGAYRPGSDADTDMAIAKVPEVNALLTQGTEDLTDMSTTIETLGQITGV
ncbi:FliI/YscN family ATPase [Alicyclobacillus fastidiosus]|uniref:FliI/YscN family ATPase n=1 Tax=Alicyclobacillus fastidiosus TaxID=392011 RepID=A0ABY6ZBI6_9BACL|nr:FliI/YscN family ATPase [Alicyclobacillus fastidiosus]WAH40209.1 FliI/YscN family ATPase [Alicyclobacillus fastidiosus]GMA61566.1 flagellum-specific ATP synthase [Alicyclobacillus fastidiosus]